MSGKRRYSLRFIAPSCIPFITILLFTVLQAVPAKSYWVEVSGLNCHVLIDTGGGTIFVSWEYVPKLANSFYVESGGITESTFASRLLGLGKWPLPFYSSDPPDRWIKVPLWNLCLLGLLIPIITAVVVGRRRRVVDNA
jgi:hypothetical protein